MARDFPLVPEAVAPVQTKLRSIRTALPAPESIPVLQTLLDTEPIAMTGQPPTLWDHAEGFQVYDRWGNCWIDWSSGVLVTNAGHSHPAIVAAIVAQAQAKLLTNYAFPTELRARLTKRLSDLLPAPMKKIFLLTVGSETVECAIKLCRAHGAKVGGRGKNVIVSYEKAFHGRTMGSQQAGGIPVLKDWIVNLDPGFVQVPFPDGFRTTDTSFAGFEQSLAAQGVTPDRVAGVILETYQGGSAAFAPVEYMQQMRAWCDQHGVLLVCDEVQAGFGRTGTLWGFSHYGIVPDLTTWGKGVSSSLPLAFIAGAPEILDMFPPGSMSSTHTGNPVCVAAALANIDVILGEGLPERARAMGEILHGHLEALRAKYPARIGAVSGKGLVAGVHCIQEGGIEPDADLAFAVVKRCWQRGVLMFNPVGFGGATVKICPPLVISEEALEESCAVLSAVFAELVTGK
ncbi:MAG: aspartate aminotransferase family protein [Bryobacteraceae bacterium]|nr:aspartate aminotransferase family protein [Bryobacteraceae bacterium]